jgi:glycosyltransferase involved in cell wall biosynthesis
MLFLSWWWPYPADNGSKLRIYNLLRQLARRHRVTLLAFADPDEATPERVAELERFCACVRTVPRPRYRPGGLRALAGFFSPRPRWLVDVFSDEMALLVQDEVSKDSYKLVIASQVSTTPYTLALKGVARLFEEIEVTVYREQFAKQASWLKRARYRLTWLKLVGYLRRARRAFDGCTAVSSIEAAHVERAAPTGAPIRVVPNGVDVPACAGDFGRPEADTLVYPGALSYAANYDAAAWFAAEILPLVTASRPEVEFRITGRTEGIDLSGFPKASRVRFTGYLDDVRPAIARSWVCVVPLRVGGGTRLKILEALALGTPVVSTSKGAEGLEVTPGHDILIADAPPAFAEAVLRLLEDERLRASLADAGRRLVESRYDWFRVGDRMLQFISEISLPAQAEG